MASKAFTAWLKRIAEPGYAPKKGEQELIHALVAYVDIRLCDCGSPLCSGRHSCWRDIECPCGWSGRRMDAEHGYSPTGHEDVEPADFCPLCGGEL